MRGIERMIEDNRYCIDVLTQISAVNTALESLAFQLLDQHVKHCVAGAFASGDEAVVAAKTSELLEAVQCFAGRADGGAPHAARLVAAAPVPPGAGARGWRLSRASATPSRWRFVSGRARRRSRSAAAPSRPGPTAPGPPPGAARQARAARQGEGRDRASRGDDRPLARPARRELMDGYRHAAEADPAG